MARGLERVLIVDWDVHAGQGTQRCIASDSRIRLVSIHRYEHGEFWPALPESALHNECKRAFKKRRQSCIEIFVYSRQHAQRAAQRNRLRRRRVCDAHSDARFAARFELATAADSRVVRVGEARRSETIDVSNGEFEDSMRRSATTKAKCASHRPASAI